MASDTTKRREEWFTAAPYMDREALAAHCRRFGCTRSNLLLEAHALRRWYRETRENVGSDRRKVRLRIVSIAARNLESIAR